jgi:hypothetical protein
MLCETQYTEEYYVRCGILTAELLKIKSSRMQQCITGPAFPPVLKKYNAFTCRLQHLFLGPSKMISASMFHVLFGVNCWYLPTKEHGTISNKMASLKVNKLFDCIFL